MFCPNCGTHLPEEGARFCPNCGSQVDFFPAQTFVAVEAPVERPLEAEELPAQAEEPVIAAVEAEEPAVEEAPAKEQVLQNDSSEEPACEEAPSDPIEPEAAPQRAPVAFSEAPKGLHGTAMTALVMLALAVLSAGLLLISVTLRLDPMFLGIFSFTLILFSELAFGIGIAAFIVGLVKKRTGTWILGLMSMLLGLGGTVLGTIYVLVTATVYLNIY